MSNVHDPAKNQIVSDDRKGGPALNEAVDGAEEGSQSVSLGTLNGNGSHSPVSTESNDSARNDEGKTITEVSDEELAVDSVLQETDEVKTITEVSNEEPAVDSVLQENDASRASKEPDDVAQIHRTGDVWYEDGVYHSIMKPFPFGLSGDDFVGAGASGIIVRLNAVVKRAHGSAGQDVAVEHRIYERLGRHKGILRYYGTEDECPILQYASNGSIRDYYTYGKKNAVIPLAMKLRWAEEIVESMAFVHSKGVHHADISGNNVLLDEHFRTKVADFAGSSIDGSEPLVVCEERFCLPWSGDGERPLTVGSEIFALGSTIYEIMVERRPYEDLEDHEVDWAFATGDFPETGSLPAFGTIIQNCWTQQYDDVDELLIDVRDEGKLHSSSYNTANSVQVKTKSSQSESLNARIPCSLCTFIEGAALLLVPLFLLAGHRN